MPIRPLSELGGIQPQPERPSFDEVDYQTDKINKQGDKLPEGATSFDPYGKPYFGPGINGTLKKYGWILTGEPSHKTTKADWDSWIDLGNKYQAILPKVEKGAPIGEIGKAAGLSALAFLDVVFQGAKNVVGYADWFEDEKKEKITTTVPTTGEKKELGVTSVVTPLLRLSKVGLQVAMDLFGEPAVKLEQAFGAQESAREISTGSPLPDIFENIQDERTKKIAEVAGMFSPVVQGYNALRFFTAPKTVAEKKTALQEGWDSGRIFYSGTIEPAIKEEFLRRYRSGEDAQLLAMELENPWAEMVGRGVFDPLNLLGVVGKFQKTGKLVDTAMDSVKVGSAFMDDIADTAKVLRGSPDDANALSKMNDLLNTRLKQIDAVEGTRLVQKYNGRALSLAGNIQNVRRTADSVFVQGTARILAQGGTPDDVAEWLKFGIMSVSKNKTAMAQGIMGLSRYGGNRWMAEDATEAFVVLRNLLVNEQGVIDGAYLIEKLRVAKGDPGKLAEIGSSLIENAAHRQFPEAKELKKAYETFLEAEKTGAKPTKKTREMAEAWQSLGAGEQFRLQMLEKAIDVKNPVNRVLGTFYFSRPGYVARNATNNLFTTVVDHGAKPFFNDGHYWSLNNAREYLKGWHGGVIPVEASGYKTMVTAEGVKTSGLRKLLPSSWASANEEAMATRVYAHRFRETMDKMLRPGVILPKIEEFRAAGFTDNQVNLFVRALKSNFGDVRKAVDEVFTGSQEAWRAFDLYIDPHDLRGLDELQITDKLSEMTRTAKSKEEVVKWFEKTRNEAKLLAGLGGEQPLVTYRMNSDEAKIADYFAAAAEYLEDGAPDQFNVVMTQKFMALEEYNGALNDAKLVAQNTIPQNTPEFFALQNATEEWTSLVTSERARKTTNRAVEQMWKNVWDVEDLVNDKGVTDYGVLWNRIGIPDAMPLGLSRRDFLNAAFGFTRKKVSETYDAYFAGSLAKSKNLADILEKFDPTLSTKFAKAEEMVVRAGFYAAAKYHRTGIELSIGQAADNVVELAARYGIPTQSKSGAKLDKNVLKIVEKYAGKKFDKLDDVPIEVAAQAFEERRAQTGAKTLIESIKLHPPYVPGATPTPSVWWKEIEDGTVGALDRLERQMLSRYGMLLPDNFGAAQTQDFMNLIGDLPNRMTEAQAVASNVGKAWRDFTMLPYGETTNFDVGASFIFPYQFWYSRTYANWLKRAATDPQVIANYFRLKDYMSKINKDSPEWYRFNVTLPEHFLGLPIEHPMLMNLEANLWPLYGLTGVDFNDPEKRVDMLTATLDDMGKFGPSVWSPIQMALAAWMSIKGEKEAASHWGGRVIPQTADIKAVAALAGKTLETDPAVQIFSGEGLFDFSAADPFEKKRIGRALGAMVESGEITDEQAVMAGYERSGPIYEKAHLNALQLRAPGQLMSFIAGVGFKARTKEDIEIDKFWNEYRYIWQLSDEEMISSEQLRSEMDRLRRDYPFMDAVLLQRKSEEKRQSALAYNVLSRIPPAQADNILAQVGIDNDIISRFYDDKGDMSKWTKGDQLRFSGAIIDLAAIYEMPDFATRSEWNAARSAYQDMKTGVEAYYGKDIFKLIDTYYGFYEEDPALADKYISQFPQVQAALDLQDRYKISNPLLYRYYGSLETVERVLKAQIRDELSEKYGDGIYDLYYQYLDLADPAERKVFRKQHKQLSPFMDDYFSMRENIDPRVVEIAKLLPDRPSVGIQPGFTPQSPTQATLAQGAPNVTPEQAWSAMSESMQRVLTRYWVEGTPLPDAAQGRLDYLSDRMGVDANTLLQLTGLAIQGR